MQKPPLGGSEEDRSCMALYRLMKGTLLIHQPVTFSWLEAVHPLWFDKMWMHYASFRWPDSKDLRTAVMRLVCQLTDLMHDAEHSTNYDRIPICWDDNEVERIRRLIRKYEEGQKLCTTRRFYY
ncbi:unnamed protein product [Acanthoscelides obtectus]|nr:unnamed protein product [Acanthoscelides obtectus]CAK1655905.1 hypothetical protein AOBTE_LOCUS19428 [Acanthoscelides obtectus]